MKPTTFQKNLAGHILAAMARAQREGRAVTLESLVEELSVRRVDARAVLSMLHNEGHVDVLKMRLTLSGFVMGASLEGEALRPLRKPAHLHLVAAA